MEWLPSHRFIEYHCAVIERILNETAVFRSFFERFWTEGSLAHFLQQLFCCKDFCRKMTKKCLHKDEKSAPFLRQKPVKKCLFSSIWREKADRNKLSICYVIYRFSYNMTQQQFIIPNRPLYIPISFILLHLLTTSRSESTWKRHFYENVPLIVNKLQRQKNMIRDFFKWTQLLSYLFPKKKGFTS